MPFSSEGKVKQYSREYRGAYHVEKVAFASELDNIGPTRSHDILGPRWLTLVRDPSFALPSLPARPLAPKILYYLKLSSSILRARHFLFPFIADNQQTFDQVINVREEFFYVAKKEIGSSCSWPLLRFANVQLSLARGVAINLDGGRACCIEISRRVLANTDGYSRCSQRSATMDSIACWILPITPDVCRIDL